MKIPIEQMKKEVFNYLMEKYKMTIEDISFLDDMDIKSLYLELYCKDKIK